VKLLLSFVFAAALSAQGLKPVDEAGYQKLIASYKGKVLLVDFWATWCAPCRAEMPQLVKLQQRLKAQGVELVTVSADEPDQVQAAQNFLQAAGVTGPAYIKQPKDDDRFINAIDPKWGGALPALFLYDRKGVKARSFVGESKMADVEAAVKKIL
jgi:thiol-disulfide isomerase/thioredoxin